MSHSTTATDTRLAIDGGPKAKATPYRTGRRFGRDELRELKEALDQNTLFYAMGKKVKQFCADLAAKYGPKYAVACSSGTASLHIALGAVGVAPGDEVITSVLTDAGTFIGILYQAAIPIFADIDPRTYNMTAETIAARLSPRTKAVIVVHLAGNPADMDPILELCRSRNIAVIEDCAQTWGARYRGRLAGTMGDLGCFSLNDYKHLSTGDGGAVLTNDTLLAGRAALFADKCYPRDETGRRAGDACAFLAPNYRMSELCGAVAIAQLRKMDKICSRRNRLGQMLTKRIENLPGILPPVVTPGAESSNWYYMLRIDPVALGTTRDDFMRALAAEGVPAGMYLKRVDDFPIFQRVSVHPPRKDGFVVPYDPPIYAPGRIKYRREDCPNVDLVLSTAIIIQMREFYSDRDIRETAAAIEKVTRHFLGRRSVK
jgi:dTDP-4-amino-4,6-dideoxygalactose transaminase